MNNNINKTNNIEIADKNDPAIAAMDAEINRIMNIDLHTFISDPEVLTIALYADDPEICEYLADCDDEDISSAACLAIRMFKEPLLREDMVYQGYFSAIVEDLLEIAKTCYDYAARLYRILALFCVQAKAYNIDEDVAEDLYVFLNDFKNKYNFEILPEPEIFSIGANSLYSEEDDYEDEDDIFID